MLKQLITIIYTVYLVEVNIGQHMTCRYNYIDLHTVSHHTLNTIHVILRLFIINVIIINAIQVITRPANHSIFTKLISRPWFKLYFILICDYRYYYPLEQGWATSLVGGSDLLKKILCRPD